ncbi:hypothetical protein HDU97_000744 [Phlyctochytrium planicorne]|nr:hypothetical protein HDU97_000744 [Phlyctochytrium planicorne]
MALLWKVIPLSDLCDFATWQDPNADGGPVGIDQGKSPSHLNNHARLVEIGPGVEQLVVTRLVRYLRPNLTSLSRFALPFEKIVLRKIIEACPRLDKLRFFHDPAIFDPLDEELPNGHTSDPLSRSRLYQHDENHILDSHVEILLNKFGSRLKAVSFESVMGLTGKSLESVRRHCSNLAHLRIKFCMDEKARDSLLSLLKALPDLESLNIIELQTSLFSASHFKQIASMKHLKALNIDTDGSRAVITPEDTMIQEGSAFFPKLTSLCLSRTHGGYEAPVVTPVLSRLDRLVDLYLTAPLDPIVETLASCGGTLRRLRVNSVMRGDSTDAVSRASDAGLAAIGRHLPLLISFHLFCAPPHENDDVFFPLDDEAISITDEGILMLLRGCKDLDVLSIRAGSPLSFPDVTDRVLTGMLDLDVKLIELRLDPVNIQLSKLSVAKGKAFRKLQVIEFGNEKELFSNKELMSSFITEFCPRIASFRYNDGDFAREYCKAAESSASFWYGWEDEDED